MPSERALRRLFRAAILTASAVGCGRAVIEVDLDASSDASTADADAAPVFGLDAAPFVWCEAGPPRAVAACGGCCTILDVPCGISAGDIASDAGTLYHCDRYCNDAAALGCSVYQGDAAPDDGGAYVMCGCTGRRFAGYRHRVAPATAAGHFANMARLEGAAVFAFERLLEELDALCAPPPLMRRVRRSIADERRHARVVTRIAKRHGAAPSLPHRPRFRARSIERMAIENAAEGCVRETYGALVATWQSTFARDEATRRAFRAIARDETRHAAVAHAVAAFLGPKLDASARVRVERARRRAIRALRDEVARAPAPDLLTTAGLPNAAQALALLDSIFDA